MVQLHLLPVQFALFVALSQPPTIVQDSELIQRKIQSRRVPDDAQEHLVVVARLLLKQGVGAASNATHLRDQFRRASNLGQRLDAPSAGGFRAKQSIGQTLERE